MRQFGELVVATGADGLDPEILAGVLLAAVAASKHPETLEAWRRKGAGFFRGESARGADGAADDIGPGLEAVGRGAAAG